MSFFLQTPTMVSIGGVFDPAWKLKFKEARWARQFFQTHPVFMVGVLLASLGNSISGGRAERVIFPGAPPWSIWLGCFFASLGNSISERRAERVSFSRGPSWSLWLGFLASLGNSISGRRAGRVSFSRRPPGLYGWGVCSLFWACAVCPGGLGFADAAHSFAVPFGLAC